MDQHDKELLEFDRIIGFLGDNCCSLANASRLHAEFVAGSEGFNRLQPMLPEYTAGVAYVHQAINYLPDFPRQEIPDLEQVFKHLEKEGSVLELEELLDMLRYLRHVHGLIAWFRQALDNFPDQEVARQHAAGRAFLESRVQQVPLLRDLQRELDNHLDDQGQLREERIPELRLARRAIIEAQSDLRKSAAAIVQSNQHLVSGDFSTLRDGRMVIPLKADFKGKIPGLIHQSSASGATLYVEPFELVEKNNYMNEAEARYHEELQRILRRLSGLCAGRIHELWQSYLGFLELDLLLARSRTGRQMNAWPCPEGPMVILNDARHPLLGSKAVPINIGFPEGCRMLVISGPNTGGKTVALKTLGLLVLMRQAGMELPCGAGSSLPFFPMVLVDIGDEQSISQNLSTFSGHLVRIRSILERTDGQSLVLLDELGSGTDPAEGSALALAVAEELLACGSTALITSHHGAVKAMAYANPSVMNASMDFSESEQRPTYRVIPGIPGKSHALDTAQRLGLPSRVMDRARQLMSGRQDVVEEMLQRLVSEEQAQRQRGAALGEKERSCGLLQASLAEREEKLRQDLDELARERNRQESLFLSEARSKVERLLMELSAWKKTASRQASGPLGQGSQTSRDEADSGQAGLEQDILAARSLLREIGGSFDSRRQTLKGQSEPPAPDGQLQAGQSVRLRQSGLEGVLQRLNRDGTWEILVKGKRMNFQPLQLELIDDSAPARRQHPKPVYSSDVSLSASFCLDLRGMRVVEARDAVIRQLDAACVQGMSQFGIIHGKGEGKLQVALAELLKQSAVVEKFGFARPEDGGSGKTIVYLRH